MADFSHLQRYYEDYINRFFTGGFLSEGELGMFEQKEKSLERRGKSLEEQALENLYKRGVQVSSVGDEFISKYVTEPMATAYSQLDLTRSQIEDKRRQEAMNYAMMKYQEEQKSSAGLMGGLGRLAGTAVGAIGGSFIPGIGTTLGAGLGSQLGSMLGGGGGDAEMMAMMQMFQTTQGNITFEEMMKKIDALLANQNTIPTAGISFPEWGSGY
jgi:hypothetical protein